MNLGMIIYFICAIIIVLLLFVLLAVVVIPKKYRSKKITKILKNWAGEKNE